MNLDQEQAMTNRTYSHLFSCLYDQQEPVGAIGRGSHYSVFRSIQWRSLDGGAREKGRLHDFAVIWDEDHDERIIRVVERLQLAGLMWPIVFVGERKAILNVLLAHQAGPIEHDDPTYVQRVREIAEDVDGGDVWDLRFGTYHRDPANQQDLSNPSDIIADPDDQVVAYLQSIDVLWQLGERWRATSPVLAA